MTVLPTPFLCRIFVRPSRPELNVLKNNYFVKIVPTLELKKAKRMKNSSQQWIQRIHSDSASPWTKINSKPTKIKFCKRTNWQIKIHLCRKKVMVLVKIEWTASVMGNIYKITYSWATKFNKLLSNYCIHVRC